MTFLKYFSLTLIFPIILFAACKEYNSLDSITVSPVDSDPSDDASSETYICKTTGSGGTGNRRFQVIGSYEDDDTEDLSSEVTWEIDATDDVLSDAYPGLVICNTAFGTSGLKATYTIDSGDSSEGEGASATELTDSVIVNAQ